MDSWSAEQAENMKMVGNVASNKIYNPQNVKPEIPIDVDEVDSAIERFIRQKYDQRSLSNARAAATRQNTGSTTTDPGSSWSEDPPELPPKPAKRFGFSLRSSSATAVKQRQDRFTPPLSPAYSGSDRAQDLPSPKRMNKQSQMFGMKITTVDNNFNAKLTHLRDMGFADNLKNTEVLKSTGGNVGKAVETLTRLGESTKPLTRSTTPGPRALTPVSMGSAGANGITVEKKVADPWEVRESVQPSIPARASSVPPQSSAVNNSWNPFLQSQPLQNQAQTGLENSFQSMSVSQPATQANSPFHTGNHAAGYQNGGYQNGGFQQSSNPFLQAHQSQPQWAQQPSQYPSAQGQQQQQAQQAPQLNQSSNPYMQSMNVQQQLTTNNPWGPQVQQQQQYTSQPQSGSGLYASAWQQQPPAFAQPQSQPVASPQPMYGQQVDFFAQSQQQPAQQQQQLSMASGNPWQHQQQQQQEQQQQQQQVQQTNMAYSNPQAQQMQQPQPQYGQFMQQYAQPQQPARHDKTSILALYGHSQLAPSRPLQTLPEDGSSSQQQYEPTAQRSVTMPPSFTTGSMNPFGGQAQQPRHVSNESVDFQGFAGNGRHSPDAFSGLSARYLR
jgi:hypothetical protein